MVNIVKQVILESKLPFPGRDIKVNVVGKEQQLNLDSQLISHALSNLVNNALKYSEGKKDPELTIDFRKTEVHLIIKDFGIGIPLKDQAELFESFSRASNVGDIEGTGLGLVIVKQFIEMHQGTVTVDSDNGRGAEFLVKLPYLLKVES